MRNAISRLARSRVARWVALVVGVPFVLYLALFNAVERGQVGLARNWISGDMWLQQPGWHITPPWVWVARIDTRPMRVAVDSSGHGYHAKLVQFNPDGWEEFVQTEGWYYYWWANRISFNFGYSEEHRGLRDIMRGYAYGAKRYSFITILREFDAR